MASDNKTELPKRDENLKPTVVKTPDGKEELFTMGVYPIRSKDPSQSQRGHLLREVMTRQCTVCYSRSTSNRVQVCLLTDGDTYGDLVGYCCFRCGLKLSAYENGVKKYAIACVVH